MLDQQDWNSIETRIEEIVRQFSAPNFTQGRVIKTDTARNLVWLKEFGDQPIPLFVFDYEIHYYDTQPTGVSGSNVNTQLIKKKAIVKPACPSVGDIVLIARQYGSRRLPKCLGVLRSRNFEALSE